MKKIKLAVIVLTVFFITVGYAYAETRYPDRAGKIKEDIYKELNLTAEQQKKLEENRTAQRQKTTELRQAMKEKEKELQQALKDPAVTMVKVEPVVNDIKSLQDQLIDQRVSGIFAVKEILTPEQAARLEELMEKRKENRKGRFQQWRQKHKGETYHEG